jgi:hypothetical protein
MAFTLNNDKIDNLITGQTRISGGMRTTSAMQRPSDDAANARARARRGKKKNRGNYGQLSAQDMIALFQSMPTPNRGFKLPGGDKPNFLGGGLDQFYANNPGIAKGPDRAGQIAAERQQQTSRGFEAGRAAVDFAKQTKGYTDAQGNFVPPTMPTTPSSNYGTGSVAFTDKPTNGTMTDYMGRQVAMDEFLPEQSLVGNSKYGAMPKAPVQPASTQRAQAAQPQNDMAALFPGNPASPSTSPLQQASMAPAQAPVQSPQGMANWSPDWMNTSTPPDSTNYLQPDWMSQQQTYAPVNDTPGAARQQSLSGAFPAGKMQGYTPPNSSPQQLEALRRLNGLFGSQSPGSAGLESVWTNILPGQNDWQGLESLFPGVVQPGAGNTQNMRRLQTLYQDPVYQSRW